MAERIVVGMSGGVDSSVAALMLKDSAKEAVATDEEHFGTKMYGTQYTVLYESSKMVMRIIIEGDSKSQSYTYDLTV